MAVCDVVREKAEAASLRYGCPAFNSVDEMGAGARLDMASMCTAGNENGGDHYQPAIALLNAGIAVLGQKPISNEIPEAREMVALTRKLGLRYRINLNNRFTSAAFPAREWVDEGYLGELNTIDVRMWINSPNDISPHFHMRALHSHSIDAIRYFGGDIERVLAFFKRGQGRQKWSNLQANMLFESGTIAI